MDFFPERSYFKKGDRVKADLSAFFDLDTRPCGTVTGETNDKGAYAVHLDYPIRWADGIPGHVVWLKAYELDYLQPVEEAARLEEQSGNLPSRELIDVQNSNEIEHPAHYNAHPSGIETIEITRHETFLRGNILKYVLRAPYKGNELQDLLKAQQYLAWEIERVEEETQ